MGAKATGTFIHFSSFHRKRDLLPIIFLYVVLNMKHQVAAYSHNKANSLVAMLNIAAQPLHIARCGELRAYITCTARNFVQMRFEKDNGAESASIPTSAHKIGRDDWNSRDQAFIE